MIGQLCPNRSLHRERTLTNDPFVAVENKIEFCPVI